MPPKKKKDKTKTELSKTGEPSYKVCSRLLKSYEQACAQDHCLVSPSVRLALKQAIDDEKFLTKMVIEPLPVNSVDDPQVKIEPVLNAMRKERYNYIKALYIWQIPLTNEEMTALALLLEKSIYDISTVELIDNMIEVYGMRRLSKALPASPAIVSLALDYNEFGDEGCQNLCGGLYGNKTMLSLSLNYCNLTAKSASCLGRVIAGTTIRELYLDGNDFACDGTVQLIEALVAQAETEIEEKKAAEEAKLVAEQLAISQGAKPGVSPAPSTEKKKKKKGKKKGKKIPPPPPVAGAWLHKLHLADNGIDIVDRGFGDMQSMQCIKTLRRLIASSEHLAELDLADNLIGNMGGSELLEGLLCRKNVNGLPSMKLRTTHRLQGDTLKELIKHGAGVIKKKKKGKGKKK